MIKIKRVNKIELPPPPPRESKKTKPKEEIKEEPKIESPTIIYNAIC